MTNKENQEIRNKEKYKESYEAHENLAQKMIWCEFCNAKCLDNKLTQEYIDKNYLCAKAYNRMKRIK